MKYKKRTYILFFVMSACYCVFLLVYCRYKTQWVEDALKKHALVIEDDVWKFDDEGPLGYLSLAAERDNFESVIITIRSTGEFLSLKGPELSVVDKFLDSILLIPQTFYTVDIKHGDQKIGTLIVCYRNMNVYTYFYVFLLFAFAYVAIFLFLKITQAKWLLEERVKERTFELETEISERVAVEDEILQLRNYLSNIIDSMPSVLIGVDADVKVTQWNKKAEEITGVSAFEAIGRTITDVYPEIKPEMNSIVESISIRELRRTQNKPHWYESGVKYEDVTIYPLLANESEDEGAVIRIEDVTDEHEMERKMHHSHKMDAIGQLAGGVAHDFNNMLAGIIGAAQMLQPPMRELDKDAAEFVEMILKAAKRAADLTAKLLTFSRKGEDAFVAMDVHQVLDDTFAILKMTIDKKITISVEQNAENYMVEGDHTAIQNVLMNLSINASHAMPDGGDISLKTSNLTLDDNYCDNSPFDIEPGGFIEVEVRDTGCGISAEDIKKIFEPFFTTKKQGKGTGLGLAAVYGVVQDHQGAIVVYSEVGEGAVFHLYLPCSEEVAVEENVNCDIVHGVGLILLVDDEEIIRITGKHMLEDMGYEVILVENGLEAIDVFEQKHGDIDLVIMDMIMPEINGREAFDQMRKIDGNCKVIISSGFTKGENLDEMRDAGLAGFINKPFRNYELSQLISTILK